MTLWPLLQNNETIANRAHMAQDLNYLFQYDSNNVPILPEDRPKVPGGLIPALVDRLVSELFPGTISLTISDENLNDLLTELEKQLNLLKKCPKIAKEGATTGTVGLKSIWNKELSRWELDVLPCETMLLECQSLNPEKITQVTIRYKFVLIENEKEVTYWHQERWTDTYYYEWDKIKQTGVYNSYNSSPSFSDTNYNIALSGPNPYGEIPVTVITHEFNLESPYGLPLINETLRKLDKAYTANVSGVSVADQLLSIPTFKRKNDLTKDKKYKWKPGAVIDLESADKELECDLAIIEYQPTPESVFQNAERIKGIAYELAQVINPDLEKEMKAGGTQSSKAYRMFYKVFLNLIDTLRLQYGRDGVEAHIHKIFRMSKALGLTEYGSIGEDVKVSIVYPPEFEPDAQEKTAELGALNLAKLPENEHAQRVAALFNITSQAVIDEIAANIEEDRAILEPSLLDSGNNNDNA